MVLEAPQRPVYQRFFGYDNALGTVRGRRRQKRGARRFLASRRISAQADGIKTRRICASKSWWDKGDSNFSASALRRQRLPTC